MILINDSFVKAKLGPHTINWGIKILRFEISDLTFKEQLKVNFVINPIMPMVPIVLPIAVPVGQPKLLNETTKVELKTPIITEVT